MARGLPCERFTAALASRTSCITRGRGGWLNLPRGGLPPPILCQLPGALRFGSKVPFWQSVGHFRSTSMNRHHLSRSACLKRAKNRLMHCSLPIMIGLAEPYSHLLCKPEERPGQQPDRQSEKNARSIFVPQPEEGARKSHDQEQRRADSTAKCEIYGAVQKFGPLAQPRNIRLTNRSLI